MRESLKTVSKDTEHFLTDSLFEPIVPLNNNEILLFHIPFKSSLSAFLSVVDESPEPGGICISKNPLYFWVILR